MTFSRLAACSLSVLCLGPFQAGTARAAAETNPPARKLYWFIPDGMRADPDLFNIYRWAADGRLPNIKRMMDRGAYGFCQPAFPSHTPANFACLLTGCYPERHGVNDGPMRAEGTPLSQVAIAGFSSTAKKVEPIWVTIEKALDCNVTVLSIPGSTPPELKKGQTIRGRWGRWGADFHALNFQDKADLALRKLDPNAARLFFMGPPLTQYLEKRAASGWQPLPQSCSPPLETSLTAWGATLHACICDRTDNQRVDYDTIVFSTDKQAALCTLKSGEWSGWLPLTLQWQVPGQALERAIPSFCRIKLIRLEPSGLFRIRVLYDNLNKFQSEPDYVAQELEAGVGPMIDFADNFPPQLIFYPEDKATFLEEAGMSLRWHRDAVPFIVKKYHPDVLIFDNYTPNQMLTSRWWLGYVDPASARYNQVSANERAGLWQDIYSLYKQLDDVIGQMLDQADPNTFVAVSSDHGAVPLDYQVRLNNLFAREGLLKFRTDAQTGARLIDWPQTKAVYIQMQNVFLNPAGLAGNWHRASGPAYEALRGRVKQLLLELKDERGVKPLEKIVEWESVRQELRLLPERAGDLVLANRAGYGWTEEMTDDLSVFSVPLIAGYKQALLPERVKGVWMPFLVVGPGIKPGHYLGEAPIQIVDQHPTLLRALGVKPPPWVQGRVLTEIFQ
jgi:predicted AlkP superfamily phosphohydrolase/phosphomutase